MQMPNIKRDDIAEIAGCCVLASVFIVAVLMLYCLVSSIYESNSEVSAEKLAEVKVVIQEYPTLQKDIAWSVEQHKFVTKGAYARMIRERDKLKIKRELGIKDDVQ